MSVLARAIFLQTTERAFRPVCNCADYPGSMSKLSPLIPCTKFDASFASPFLSVTKNYPQMFRQDRRVRKPECNLLHRVFSRLLPTKARYSTNLVRGSSIVTIHELAKKRNLYNGFSVIQLFLYKYTTCNESKTALQMSHISESVLGGPTYLRYLHAH